jgi:hypothetical protein
MSECCVVCNQCIELLRERDVDSSEFPFHRAALRHHDSLRGLSGAMKEIEKGEERMRKTSTYLEKRRGGLKKRDGTCRERASGGMRATEVTITRNKLNAKSKRKNEL